MAGVNFANLIALLCIPLILTTRPIAYFFLQSPAIRTSFLMFVYPLIVVSYIKSQTDYSLNKNWLEVSFALNTIMLLVSAITSGSRINSYLVPFELLCTVIVCLRHHKSRIKVFLIYVNYTFLFNFDTSVSHLVSYSGWNRKECSIWSYLSSCFCSL